MKELVEYLDEYVEELREQLLDPRVMRDNRWRKRPFMGRRGLPFQKGAKKGKLGMQMGKEALIMWIREKVPYEERNKKKKPCDNC